MNFSASDLIGFVILIDERPPTVTQIQEGKEIKNVEFSHQNDQNVL